MKSKVVAIIIAVLFGPWVWLGTYGKDRGKFWLSIGLIMAVPAAIIITKLPNSPYGFVDVSLYTIFPFVIFLISHDIFSGAISFFFASISDITLDFNFIFVFLLWAALWFWALADTVIKQKTRFTDEQGKSNWRALFFAVLFSYNAWLYTYTRNAKKFWVSFGISNLAIPLCVGRIKLLSIPGEGAFYVLMGLLILVVPSVFIGIWLWAVIDALSRIRHKYS